MDVVRDAIRPLELLGACGWLLRRIGFLDSERRLAVEILISQVLLPALLVSRLAVADIRATMVAPLAASVLLTILAVALKLLLMPALAWLAATAPVRRGETTLALVLFHAAPTATASYVLTRQLGGDGELMAGVISVQTVCAVATIPAVLLVLGVWGPRIRPSTLGRTAFFGHLPAARRCGTQPAVGKTFRGAPS